MTRIRYVVFLIAIASLSGATTITVGPGSSNTTGAQIYAALEGLTCGQNLNFNDGTYDYATGNLFRAVITGKACTSINPILIDCPGINCFFDYRGIPLDAPYSGTADVSGTTFTWVSGDLFNSVSSYTLVVGPINAVANSSGTTITWVAGPTFESLVGYSAVIGGVGGCTVATNADSTHVTVSGCSPGTQTGVPVSFSLSGCTVATNVNSTHLTVSGCTPNTKTAAPVSLYNGATNCTKIPGDYAASDCNRAPIQVTGSSWVPISHLNIKGATAINTTNVCGIRVVPNGAGTIPNNVSVLNNTFEQNWCGVFMNAQNSSISGNVALGNGEPFDAQNHNFYLGNGDNIIWNYNWADGLTCCMTSSGIPNSDPRPAVVNTSGNMIVWVSGNKFHSGLALQASVNAGNATLCPVSSYISQELITVRPECVVGGSGGQPVGTQTGVNFTVNAGGGGQNYHGRVWNLTMIGNVSLNANAYDMDMYAPSDNTDFLGTLTCGGNTTPTDQCFSVVGNVFVPVDSRYGNQKMLTFLHGPGGHLTSGLVRVGGSGYQVNDVLTIAGTCVSGDAGSGATIHVDSLSGSAVATFTITAGGGNYDLHDTCPSTGGHGSGFTIYVAGMNQDIKQHLDWKWNTIGSLSTYGNSQLANAPNTDVSNGYIFPLFQVNNSPNETGAIDVTFSNDVTYMKALTDLSSPGLFAINGHGPWATSTISNSGTGYLTGDVLTFGASQCIGYGSDFNPAKATVTASSGHITALSFTNFGDDYIIYPTLCTPSGGTGTGAVIGPATLSLSAWSVAGDKNSFSTGMFFTTTSSGSNGSETLTNTSTFSQSSPPFFNLTLLKLWPSSAGALGSADTSLTPKYSFARYTLASGVSPITGYSDRGALQFANAPGSVSFSTVTGTVKGTVK